jgi:hypothetical protein
LVAAQAARARFDSVEPSELLSCEPVPDATCSGLTVNLLGSSLTNDVWSEPLQVPKYGTRPDGYYPPSANTDPASWDRSPLPAGACVFRIHGLTPNCVRSGTLWEASCQPDGFGDERLLAPSFYETGVCMRHIAPGCPTADPWNAAGHWWYLQPDGENVDLVVCAPECASSIVNNSPCLELPGPLP